MVACDIGRAAVVATLPFVDNLSAWCSSSLALEVFTLLWSPAKDATVPNLVPPDHLTTANSLSLAAAYGTFPFAALLFAAAGRCVVVAEPVRRVELLEARSDGAGVLRRRAARSCSRR